MKIASVLKQGLRALIAVTPFLLPTFANAGPVPKWAWADAGAGLASAETGPFSILVAVAASMAVGVDAPPSNSGSGVTLGNPLNKYDQYGALHNQIVLDYYQEYRRFDLGDYYAFLEENMTKYGFTTLPSKSVFEQAISEYGNRRQHTDDLLARVDAELKADGVSEDYVGQVRKLNPNQTLQAQINSIIQIENAALSSSSLSAVQLQQLSIFFSILRYSDGLWTPVPPWGPCPGDWL